MSVELGIRGRILAVTMAVGVGAGALVGCSGSELPLGGTDTTMDTIVPVDTTWFLPETTTTSSTTTTLPPETTTTTAPADVASIRVLLADMRKEGLTRGLGERLEAAYMGLDTMAAGNVTIRECAGLMLDTIITRAHIAVPFGHLKPASANVEGARFMHGTTQFIVDPERRNMATRHIDLQLAKTSLEAVSGKSFNPEIPDAIIPWISDPELRTYMATTANFYDLAPIQDQAEGAREALIALGEPDCLPA